MQIIFTARQFLRFVSCNITLKQTDENAGPSHSNSPLIMLKIFVQLNDLNSHNLKHNLDDITMLQNPFPN